MREGLTSSCDSGRVAPAARRVAPEAALVAGPCCATYVPSPLHAVIYCAVASTGSFNVELDRGQLLGRQAIFLQKW